MGEVFVGKVIDETLLFGTSYLLFCGRRVYGRCVCGRSVIAGLPFVFCFAPELPPSLWR